MMKKLLSAILGLMLLVMLLPLSAIAASGEDMVGESIVYQVDNYHWEGQKLYIQGCVANLNSAYDLVGMKDAVMVITDSAGLELCSININDDIAENFILRPQSKIPFNFIAKNLLHNRNDYTSLTSGLRVRFASFSYQYAECEGANCPYCRNKGFALNTILYDSASGTNNSGSSAKTCPICRGNKKCKLCGGLKKCPYVYGTHPCINGKIRAGDRTITCPSCNGTAKCRDCSGTGKCTYCDGTGKR